MATRQAIGGGFPFPVYVNETATDQRIATGGEYVNETVANVTTVVTHELMLLGFGV
jgi:hypothetical protein